MYVCNSENNKTSSNTRHRKTFHLSQLRDFHFFAQNNLKFPRKPTKNEQYLRVRDLCFIIDRLNLIHHRTGVTGFIGGDVLYGLTQKLAGSKIVALVRNQSQAAAVTGRFPTVTPLLGDLDSVLEIKQAASQADVVLRMSFHGVLSRRSFC